MVHPIAQKLLGEPFDCLKLKIEGFTF